MTLQSQTIFLCEGFHDRAFLAGWLEALGCESQASPSQPVRDPWGRPVTRGQYGFKDPRGRFVRVVPVGGNTQIFSVARDLLQGRATHLIRDLLIVVDADHAPKKRMDQFASFLSKYDHSSTEPCSGELQDGTRIHLVLFSVEGPSVLGVPQLQCLEKVVCTAITACYQDRSQLVGEWLAKLPVTQDPGTEAKAAAWSYMAGWFPKHGCEAFYRVLWDDRELKSHLIQTLSESSSWETVLRVIEDEV